MSRLDNWADPIDEENRNVESIVENSADSWIVYRNTGNDGFESDGQLQLIGSLDGALSQSEDKLILTTNSQLLVENDVIKSSLGEFRIVKYDYDVESDSCIAEVVKI
jgi:hypothetical protein